MTEHKREAKGGGKEARVRKQRKSAKFRVDNPILQLQQTIGNKAVTNLIQRHEAKSIKLDADLKNMVLNETMIAWMSPEEERAQETKKVPVK